MTQQIEASRHIDASCFALVVEFEQLLVQAFEFVGAESAGLLNCFVGNKAGAQSDCTRDFIGASAFAVEDAYLEQYPYLACNHKNHVLRGLTIVE
jgi:hypothetical protein